MDIRITLPGVGEITESAATEYLATGLIPEAVLLDTWPFETREQYRSLDSVEQLAYRRSFDAVMISAGTVTDGQWDADFGLDVRVYPHQKNAMHERDIEISTGGTTRSVTDTQALLAALQLATVLAHAAELQLTLSAEVPLR